MSIARGFPITIHKDFNEFWLMGGYPGKNQPFPDVTETFKDGQMDPSLLMTNVVPAQISHLYRDVCHVHLDQDTHFFGKKEM